VSSYLHHRRLRDISLFETISGIGKGLAEAYLAHPNNTVIAAVRDPTDFTSQSLKTLPKASSSSLIVVRIRSTSDSDAADAVRELQTTYNITSLDVVIANAGLSGNCPRVDAAKVSDLQEYYHVNVIGVIVLFQAVLPLLRNSSGSTKFVSIGSIAGTIGSMEDVPVPNANYGPAKAALNWVTKKIHIEHEDLTSFPIHPGWVPLTLSFCLVPDVRWSRFTQTDTANKAARSFGLEEAPVPLKDSIAGLIKVVSQTSMFVATVLVRYGRMELIDRALDRRVDERISWRQIRIIRRHVSSMVIWPQVLILALTVLVDI
jgi:norsolorinic acid ketoreductase